jgi:hypothetical protein
MLRPLTLPSPSTTGIDINDLTPGYAGVVTKKLSETAVKQAVDKHRELMLTAVKSLGQVARYVDIGAYLVGGGAIGDMAV